MSVTIPCTVRCECGATAACEGVMWSEGKASSPYRTDTTVIDDGDGPTAQVTRRYLIDAVEVRLPPGWRARHTDDTAVTDATTV